MSAPPFPQRSRAGALAWLTLLAVSPAQAETQIRALTEVIVGHAVGGVTTDWVGNLYVADFGETVWKLTPERPERAVFASNLYGASGNAVDNDGNLLQANFYGNVITRIDRKGEARPFVTSGLRGPVGINVTRSGDIYVANCSGNFVGKVAPDGTMTTFATSDLFKCPNGISSDRDGNLYVVNFRDNRMLKIDAKGTVSPFATISGKGLGHLCFREDRFFVTAFASHEIYQVKLDATVRRILGNGERGIVDGAGDKARLSFPNGIACYTWAPRLYINEFANESSSLPRRAIIREVVLDLNE